MDSKTLANDYVRLLEHSYENCKFFGFGNDPANRLEYLGDYIFDFTTYDGEMSELFAKKAVDVCAAINNGMTFEYIKDRDNYTWYLMMCNMPFFSERINWGGSIRGAWWDLGKPIKLESCGLWIGESQLSETIEFTTDEWIKFVSSIIEFSQIND